MKQKPNRKRAPSAPSAPQPIETPVVHHGDTMVVLYGEIGNALGEIGRARKLTAAITAYAIAHPAEHKHLADFIAARG